ncbi:MAG: type IV pilin-like G/H family protein [Coleofasciculus sp. A1-SPW-01]|uniref:type IV pilin-like G/H family protein n=1 Tax=Coleofasciculus sp. A1-SPW-01 TaxID=3070819 RepID=UPI0032FD43E5
MLSAGQVLRDRYQLQKPLGYNAGRQTWLAMDTQASPPTAVVVKLLMFNPQMQWDELKLFQREAQILKNLNHPRIPKYLDYFSMDDVEAGLGEYAADNNDKYNVTDLPWFALVQDYIPGESLKQLLDQGKRFSENQVRHFAEDLLKILIDLHELSPPVLHRDIKPSNLILGKNNQIYLVDFGAVQDKAKAEGVTFTVVGTSGYAPPEQLWGKAVPASDLYALGATLIHLLTGIPPSQLPQQRMRIKFQDKVRINPNFANWIEQLIQPAPERRVSTARQAFSSLQSSLIPHHNQIPAQGSRRYLDDSDSGYGCGCLALLGLIGIGFILLLIPSFFNSAGKAMQSEAKQYIGSMNRAQQAYFLEKGNFTNNIGELGLGINTETKNYTYSTYATLLSAINYSVSRQPDLKSYVGGVFLGRVEATGELTTLAILCETKDKGTNRPPAPIVEDGTLQCAPGTENLDGENERGIFLGEDWKLVDVSVNYAKAGEYTQALDTAETITNDLIKVKALDLITTELMVVGKSKQALPIIEKIQAIALNLTDAGESEQALRVTRHITDDSIQSKTIQAIAPYLTTSAEYEQAIQVAKTITDYEPKAKALDAIVRRLVATGNPERAVQIAQTIQSYYGGKEQALATIERYKN